MGKIPTDTAVFEAGALLSDAILSKTAGALGVFERGLVFASSGGAGALLPVSFPTPPGTVFTSQMRMLDQPPLAGCTGFSLIQGHSEMGRLLAEFTALAFASLFCSGFDVLAGRAEGSVLSFAGTSGG